MNLAGLLDDSRVAALSGATAGLVTTLALHPLDVIKTRLQGASWRRMPLTCPGCCRVSNSVAALCGPRDDTVQDTGSVSQAVPSGAYRGTVHALRTMVQTEARARWCRSTGCWLLAVGWVAAL